MKKTNNSEIEGKSQIKGGVISEPLLMKDNQYKNGHGVLNNETDEAWTPEYAVLPILKYIPKNFKVWCPFDLQHSKYVEIISKTNLVVFSHINDEENKDFFTYEPNTYDIIISNPPFSKADDILKRLYGLGKPFIMLMPLKYLQSVKRCKLFKEYGIQLLSFDKRVGYYVNGDFSKIKEGNNQASAYFCWNILPKDLIIEILNKNGE